MIEPEILDKAIAAHAGWKARLRTATHSGKFDVPAATVKADNQCDFGKWLYGSDLSAGEKQSETYRAVRQLHAQFHQEAAKIVDMVTSGQKESAEKAMAVGGSYTKVSSALTEAVVKWRDGAR